MLSLMQAATRSREDESWPPSGQVSLRELLNYFTPDDRRSFRSLQATMNARASQAKPWAIILCRFSDQPVDVAAESTVKDFFEKSFQPGNDSISDFWHDVSLGRIDVSGSKVFDWRNVDIKTSEAGGNPKSVPPGIGRGGLIGAAVRAMKRDHLDPFTGFHSQISVYRANWSGVPVGWSGPPPAGAGPGTPGWGHLWIDGSAWGIQANLTPPFSGAVTAHEMGHGFDMQHDADSAGVTLYPDPCCLMSQNGSFIHPGWGRAVGPAVCLPHLLLKGWMYTHRVLVDDGGWAKERAGISFQLAPITEPSSPSHLGATLRVPGAKPGWEYILEYVDATYWNRGVPGMPYVMIRRLYTSDVTGAERNASYLAAAYVNPSGDPTTVVEQTGGTTFTVSRAPGPRSAATIHVRKGMD